MRPKMRLPLALLITLAAAPLHAGDAAKGEADFKKCRACHQIVADDGTEIQKGGKTGPNLYGVIGRTVGSAPGYNYSESFQAAAAKGLVWDEALLADYVADPGQWLKDQTGDAAARTKMSFKLTKGGADMAAYLAHLKP